jgi:transposase IS204/IS1001/IS1096/IS1165 family protein
VLLVRWHVPEPAPTRRSVSTVASGGLAGERARLHLLAPAQRSDTLADGPALERPAPARVMPARVGPFRTLHFAPGDSFLNSAPDRSVLTGVVPSTVSANCPVCGTTSTRRHTWYRRTALDLPWRKFTVRLRVWARRFFCDEPSCRRKISAERFTGLLPRYARRTEQATGLLLAFAQRAGGEAGARLARAAGLPTSPDTLRRLLRNQDFGVSEAPAELGWMILPCTVDRRLWFVARRSGSPPAN